MKVKEESEKAHLKLNIQKIKIMASSPISSWQIDGGKVETVLISFSWVPKSMQMVTTATKLRLFQDSPWKKSYDKSQQCIKKQRHHIL